eukprot:1158374-Pelagomonas_calceolata.AAC.5
MDANGCHRSSLLGKCIFLQGLGDKPAPWLFCTGNWMSSCHWNCGLRKGKSCIAVPAYTCSCSPRGA